MPRIFNSELDSASPTAKTSSVSSPMSVSMMIFCCANITGQPVMSSQAAKKSANIFEYLLIDILIQPLQLFSHLDVSVPGILIQPMPFARKREKCVRNMDLLKSPFHQHIFKKADAHIGIAANKMRR